MNAMIKRLAFGAAAGFAGTIALQVIRKADERFMPGAQAPIRQHPGRFMIQKAERALAPKARRRFQRRIMGKPESLVADLLGLGYGVTFGLLLGAGRREEKRVLRDGILFGLITWAVGYLGWLPAARLMPPVWKHRPKQIIVPIAEHALYGIATAAGYRSLLNRAGRPNSELHHAMQRMRDAIAAASHEIKAH